MIGGALGNEQTGLSTKPMDCHGDEEGDVLYLPEIQEEGKEEGFELRPQ